MLQDKKKEIDDWTTFSQNYLEMAKLGALEMINQKYGPEFAHGYSPIFSEQNLFIPTMYNVKHGIEILIKTLKFTLSKKLEKNDKKHDVKELFEMLKSETKKHKIEEVINREYDNEKSLNANKINLNIAKEDLKNLTAYIDRIENLVLKYYHCTFIQDKMVDATILEDVKNTLFRYPENDTKIKIDYDNVILKITEIDKDVLLKDIESLVDDFNGLGFIFYTYQKNVK